MKNYGFKVEIRFDANSAFGKQLNAEGATLHNITEIHYRYLDGGNKRMRVAFESDIHGTGISYAVSDIAEFEATIETKKQKEF